VEPYSVASKMSNGLPRNISARQRTVYGPVIIQCESKNPPCGFLTIFSKLLGIFNQFFTRLLHFPFYTRLQIFIQLFPTFKKLCYNKRDHPANFYISLER